MLLAEQLEFDFFAPPEHEKPKADKKPADSTAIKDADILNYQLNRDGSRKLQDFGEDLHNTRKGRSLNRSTEPYNSSRDPRKNLKNVSLLNRWIRFGLKVPSSSCIKTTPKRLLVCGS